MGVAAGLAVAGIAAGAASGIASANAASAQADAEERRSRFARRQSSKFLKKALGDIADFKEAGLGLIRGSRSFFERTPDPQTFFDDAADLDRRGFDYRTGLKRENLDFVLGDTEGDLRNAQAEFAQIAGGDFSSITRAVNSRLLGVAARSAGSPLGTVFNVAARDELNFRQLGLSQALGISDFFAREGTVDPPNPIPTTFALAEFADREDTQELGFRERSLDRELGLLDAVLGERLTAQTNALGVSTEQGLAGLGASAGAGSAQTASTLSSVSQGLSSISGYLQQREAQQVNAANVAEYNRINGTNFQAVGG